MKTPDSPNTNRLIAHLRSLLGVEVIHQGIRCQLLEILDDGPTLVLQDRATHTTIQDNQYGGPWRRVPTIYTIPLTVQDGTELHPSFIALNLPMMPH